MFGMTTREKADLAELKVTATAAAAGLARHEAVCAERQGEIREQLRSVQSLIRTVAIGIMGTLAIAILNFITTHFPTEQ